MMMRSNTRTMRLVLCDEDGEGKGLRNWLGCLW